MHSGMYGMYALQESVRQMRGIAPAQIPDAKISVCHGVGGMFAASGTITCRMRHCERRPKATVGAKALSARCYCQDVIVKGLYTHVTSNRWLNSGHSSGGSIRMLGHHENMEKPEALRRMNQRCKATFFDNRTAHFSNINNTEPVWWFHIPLKKVEGPRSEECLHLICYDRRSYKLRHLMVLTSYLGKTSENHQNY